MVQEGDRRTVGTPDDPTAPSASLDPWPDAQDPRIGAVMAVLRGATVEAVAGEYAVDPTLLERWVAAFVDAGTATVTNRPDPRAAQHRDRFLAAFAFEMRSPLAVALGWVNLLTDTGGPGVSRPAGSLREAATRLEQALGQLSDRVADVELLVSAAMGGLQVDGRRVRVADLCADLGIEVTVGHEEDPTNDPVTELEIEVDPRLLGLVLRDLWQAAGMAPEPRSRRLVVRVNEPWVELRIVREADPIDTEVLQALFEPFEFEHLTTGVTTGLYLARALTVAHGGTVGVDQDEHRAALWVQVPHHPAPGPVPDGHR